MDLALWIRQETLGAQSLVELGAGRFDMLIHSTCPVKIGIELSSKYVFKAALNHDCIKIQGNALDVLHFIGPPYRDHVMLIDVIEHLAEKDARFLITILQENFKKILIFTPDGLYPQTYDPWGFEEHDLQTHRSSWVLFDFLNLGFKGVAVPNFHKTVPKKLGIAPIGALFVTWIK